jgi:hypothetical protein
MLIGLGIEYAKEAESTGRRMEEGENGGTVYTALSIENLQFLP